ncbi:acyl carrier protein [Herminiimonas arsenitoxidans]|uniref:acyl carrier protein n=1 Tax=Herminiimonas arsenitoxidans TaxID=1809410 RepID=UPI000970CF13|nr:acyl carrier protein [Herminiimonas arsenitoxidans]
MQNDIQLYVLALLQKKSRLPKDFDDASDFISTGIIDSIAIIKFILALEEKFDIEITDSDLESEQFRSVQGLAMMISKKTGTTHS